MTKEIRTLCFDAELKIEAYRFEGIMQKFYNHFHDDYVVGFIESGRRSLSCKNREYTLRQGDVVVFNPGDNHSCEQIMREPLDYRCLNIPLRTMKQMAREITGGSELPYFKENVLYQNEIAATLQELHGMIMKEEKDFAKEECFFSFLEQLFVEAAGIAQNKNGDTMDREMKAACDYLEDNYAKSITLGELSEVTGLSKYHFLRQFTRQRGISPYNYVLNIRIGKAKKLLEGGASPAEAAYRTGFCDQSHFTKFFKRFIGLTPGYFKKICRKEK